jgi:choline dehydrogenase-like flavoprotein
MITDILALESDARLEADVVVVGSGIAGAEVATFLARRGVNVLLLESGREDFDPAIQALNDVSFTAKPHRVLDPDASYHRYLPPEQRGASRIRQFGGTSNAWTGKWKHLQRSDFAPRPWVPDSDWPIGFDTLLAHYRSAAAEYGFGDLEAEARRAEIEDLRRRVALHGLKLSSFWWEKTPTRTRIRFGDEMRALPSLRVVLGATATELLTDPSGRRIEGVVCRSLEGRRLVGAGHRVVLATGGLETPRLLLASDRQVPGGIGNAHDLVGRYYTDHPKHHSGILRPGPLARTFAREFQYKPKPRFCVCFALDDRTQRERRLLEHVIYLKPVYETRRVRVRRWLRRTPACRDGRGTVADYRVKLVSEQVPNRESRVRLGARRDALGMRELLVEWRFTPQDHASVDEVVRLADARFRAAGLGVFDFGDALPAIDTMTDAAHQMGTARMADSPERGVVDPDCRVWGTENLYVASAAVFPTGPSYSPTFTILALARRLGEHLLDERAAPPPAARGEAAVAGA